MRKHKTIKFGIVEVDEKIAPLILACWKRGIQTTHSCQDNVPKGWMWIAFPLIKYLEDFVWAMTIGKKLKKKDELYDRIVQQWMPSTKVERSKWWKYGIVPVLGDKQHFHAVAFGASVRFPASDFPEVLRRMEKDS